MNNTQSPLVPQGSLLDQKQTNRARVKVAVFFVLAVHAIGLMALLMQGCRKEEPVAQQTTDPAAAATASTVPATTTPASTTVVDNSTAGLPAAPLAPVTAAATPVTPPAETTATPAPGTASEYTVAQGDNFWTIGKKFGVSSKAIADANPTADPAKLKIGQKLHVPAPVAKTTPATATMVADAASGEQSYTVKSGDNLLKIAGQYHTSVKAIRSANSLTTDRITVGQKLKIPKATASSSPTTAALPAVIESAAVTSATPILSR
jgi:LysM repeat protein